VRRCHVVSESLRDRLFVCGLFVIIIHGAASAYLPMSEISQKIFVQICSNLFNSVKSHLQ
jgi:hypothetical protein